VLTFSKKHVLEALPSILKRIALNGERIQEACQLLWELGRDDQRELSQHPDHAIRILGDLASYEERKPLFYSEEVLKAAERWLADENLASYKYSPLDVISPLLAKQAEYHRLEGHSVIFGYQRINLSVVQPLRERVIACVGKCLAHPSVKVAARALKAVHEIITYPVSFTGRVVSDKEIEEWKPEQLVGVKLLKDFLTRTNNAVLKAYAKQEFGRYAGVQKPIEVGTAVADALSVITPSVELDLTTALTGGLYEIGRGQEDAGSQQREFLIEVTKQFFSQYPETLGVEKLESLFSDIRVANIRRGGSAFFAELGRNEPKQAQRVLQHMFGHETCLLAENAGALLFGIRLSDPKLSLALCDEMLTKHRKVFDEEVATAFANFDLTEPYDEDFSILKELLAREWSKYNALQALRRLKNADNAAQRRGVDLLLFADIGSSTAIAEAMSEGLDVQMGISPDLLKDEEIELILNKLVVTNEITEQMFHLSRLLSYFVKRSGTKVVDFFLKRIDYSIAHKDDQASYTPTPFGLSNLFGDFTTRQDYATTLRHLVELQKGADPLKRYFINKLFGLVAGPFGPATQNLIVEMSGDKDEETYKLIAGLLEEAPSNFIFSNNDLCARLLEGANVTSKDALRRITAGLIASTQSGVFTGIPGQPAPGQVSIRDRANQLALEYAQQPVVADFYRLVAQDAQRLIDEQLERDEEEFIE
jgi:hypothetical protein